MMTEDILVKYLAGETEAHEVAMIEKWRLASEDNERHFRQLETLWKGSEGLKDSQAVDVDMAWGKVQTQLQSKPKGRMVPMGTRWLVAASLVLLIGLAVFFVNRNVGTEPEMMALNASNASKNIQLSDGSRVMVKSGQLLYPKAFGTDKRKVKLNSGKVFFDIASNKEKPFEIEANNTVVTVLGTEFEVVSYTDYTQVMVKEGKVKFSTPDGEVLLTAGMAAKYLSKENRLENMPAPSKNAFAYTSGKLVFENDKLSSVIADINRFYDAEVSLEHEGLATCMITSSFPNESLENVLAVIAGTLQLEIEHVPNSNKIILKGKGCRP
jgi:transmembrane sensor